MRKLLLPVATLALTSLPQTPPLTIDYIMRGPGLVGYEPSQVRWSGDSRQVCFQWKCSAQKDDAPNDSYVVNRDGSGLRKLSDDEVKVAPPTGGDLSNDRR